MVAVKASDVDTYLARLDRAAPVVLIFGPDAGLVSERVNAVIAASVDDPADPFSLVRLDGEDVSAHPARLDRGGADHPAVRRPPRGVGEGRKPQHRARRRGASRPARLRMPGGDRGRRPAPQRAAARAVRARQKRGGPALLCGCRTRSGAPRRQRDARRRPDAGAGRARSAHSAARRRPRRFAQRAAQARPLRRRQRHGRHRRGDRGRLRRFGAGARRPH